MIFSIFTILYFLIFSAGTTILIGHFAGGWFKSTKYWMCDKNSAKCIPCPDNKKCKCAPPIEENKKFGVKAAPAVETCLTKDECQKHCPGWYCTGRA